jgi:hypothetical protein
VYSSCATQPMPQNINESACSIMRLIFSVPFQ